MEAQNLRGFQPRVAHVVGVADPRHLLPLDGTAVFFKGHDVRHDLHGVVFIRKTVDDGHLAVFCKCFQTILSERTNHDEVNHPGHHLRRIFNGFRAPQLRALARQVDDVAAELIKARFEGNTRTGTRLFKNHQKRLAVERLVGNAVLHERLNGVSAFQHVVEFFGREVSQLQKMTDRHRRSVPKKVSKKAARKSHLRTARLTICSVSLLYKHRPSADIRKRPELPTIGKFGTVSFAALFLWRKDRAEPSTPRRPAPRQSKFPPRPNPAPLHESGVLLRRVPKFPPEST